ncbi:MAG: hypothetical protein ABR884_01685 [Minisyncoccia bacterium]
MTTKFLSWSFSWRRVLIIVGVGAVVLLFFALLVTYLASRGMLTGM